jgi:2-oxoglutarate dehydrogenase E1 component
MGAYSYCDPRITTSIRAKNMEKPVKYVGRPVSAAPATGMPKVHLDEYQKIMQGVFES